MKKCKICEINDSVVQQTIHELCKNASFKEASVYAKQHGIMASATGIEAHYKKHNKKHIRNPQELEEPVQTIQTLIQKNVGLHDDDVIKNLAIARYIVQRELQDYCNDPIKNIYPKNAIAGWNTIEKIYTERQIKEKYTSDKIFGNDEVVQEFEQSFFILLPGGENLTSAQFENFACYEKMRLGLPTKKPTGNVIIYPNTYNLV